MKLSKYNQKRNFAVTSEPVGKVKKQKGNRFVIQYHNARVLHYDFRLEFDGVLISFAVPKGLPKNESEKRLAIHVEDHPVSYINFEGTIPKGEYGAGVVKVFDSGRYEPLCDFKAGLKQGKLKFLLKGKKYTGEYTLVKKDEKNWFMIKSKESIEEKRKSTKNPFDSVSVMLCQLQNEVPKGQNYIYEVKYDGYRIVAFIEDEKVTLKSRNMGDYTEKFSSLIDSLKIVANGQSMVLDGEVVCYDDEGKSNFSLLQKSIKQKKDNFCYMVFDILALDGKDVRSEKLSKRKEILKKILKNSPKNIIFSEYVRGKGQECFAVAKESGLEGIVAKDINSIYSGTRSGDWIKIKCYRAQEFVIGGYLTSEKNKLFSSLLLGYYKNGKLIFAGKVGTGFTENDKKDLMKTLSKSTRKTSPFDIEIKDAHYVNPTLVAQIQFAEFTSENVLRQASFLGIREDKMAKDVALENSINIIKNTKKVLKMIIF